MGFAGKAAPEGYTIAMGSFGLWMQPVNPYICLKLSVDPIILIAGKLYSCRYLA